MFATDIDPRWQKLFTSKAAGKYKGEFKTEKTKHTYLMAI